MIPDPKTETTEVTLCECGARDCRNELHYDAGTRPQATPDPRIAELELKLRTRLQALTEKAALQQRVEQQAAQIQFWEKRSETVEEILTDRDQLKQRVEQVTAERDDLQKARNELWTHWNTRDTACRAAEQRLDAAQREIAAYKKGIGELRDAWDAERAAKEAAEATIASLREALDAARKEIVATYGLDTPRIQPLLDKLDAASLPSSPVSRPAETDKT